MVETGKTVMISDTYGKADRVPGLIRTFFQHRDEGLRCVAPHHQGVDLPAVSGTLKLVLVICFDDTGKPSILPDDREAQCRSVSRLFGSAIAASHI